MGKNRMAGLVVIGMVSMLLLGGCSTGGQEAMAEPSAAPTTEAGTGQEDGTAVTGVDGEGSTETTKEAAGGNNGTIIGEGEGTGTGDTGNEPSGTAMEEGKEEEAGSDLENQEDTKKDEPEKSAMEIYQEMIGRSLLSTGNNYRIKKVIEKARNGEEVLLAYIGGSITEGANASDERCYVTQSYKGFQKLFGQDDGENISFINAGMGGTPSALGIIRYDRDVVQKSGKQPDIVFIEFSVNDWQEPTKGEAYESLIRKVYDSENAPAVVLVFAVFKSRWNMQDNYIPMGKLYDLPMVSIRNAVVPALDTDHTLTNEEYFSDEYHPTAYGHMIMADCITNLFRLIDEEEMDEEFILPEKTIKGSSYTDTIMLAAGMQQDGVQVERGSFTKTDGRLGTFRYDNATKTFPDNWMHGMDSGTDPLVITVECRNILAVYKQSSSTDTGSVDVYIDGEYQVTLDGYSAGGWNNPITEVLLKGDETAVHTVEFRMSEGSEEKEFSILALGLSGLPE